MTSFDRLRQEVCEANRALAASGLAPLTWGNVSGISADRRFVAIKPSGVRYEALLPADIPIVDLAGNVVDGTLRPSTDTPTHCAIYAAWPAVGGIAHSHSLHACMFAQARRDIPCLGTTHADHFAGAIPVTRQLRPEEVEAGYEAASGAIIVETFRGRDPMLVPGVLLAGHAPFAWGRSPGAAVENAIALEAVARMAFGTLALGGGTPLEPHLLAKHHERKRGSAAYYGQTAPPSSNS